MLVCQSCRHHNHASSLRCAKCDKELHNHAKSVHPAPVSMPPSGSHANDDPMIGQVLGNFRIDEKIARGGFGAVYRGTHTILDQPCAIKVLHFHQKDFETEARFKREAGTLAQLHHPYIVRMNDFGMLPSGGFYLVMELLQGPTLYRLFKQGTIFSLTRIKRLAQQMCDVLGYISNKGMVHRDLKPGNIFLEADEKGGEQVKLIDFGIVSLLFSPDELTQTGAYLGTAKYGSPEQIRGVRQLDVRSDLYALGVVLYRMLTGRVPFVGRGGSVLTIIQQQVYEPPPTLSSINATQPWAPELEAFFQKALAKPPGDRYPTAEAFQEAFSLAIAAHEDLLVDGIGDMTVLDTRGGAPFDPMETAAAVSLPEGVIEALKGAASTQEKREILRGLYEGKQGKQDSQGTRTLQPPSGITPDEVQLNYAAATPSFVGLPAMLEASKENESPAQGLRQAFLESGPNAGRTLLDGSAANEASKSPRQTFLESGDDASRTMLDAPKSELPDNFSNNANNAGNAGNTSDTTNPNTPLASQLRPVGMDIQALLTTPLPESPPLPPPAPLTEHTVPAAINPILAAHEALSRAESELFDAEPTALRPPGSLPGPGLLPPPVAPPGGHWLETTQDDKTSTNASHGPPYVDPLQALFSQGDARIPLIPSKPPPWGWISLGAGLLLIFMWAIW